MSVEWVGFLNRASQVSNLPGHKSGSDVIADSSQALLGYAAGEIGRTVRGKRPVLLQEPQSPGVGA